jgi:hypothetical protein
MEPNMTQQIGFYDFYTAGKFNGQGPNLIMFRTYKPDGSFGSCQCVEEQNAAKEREAYQRIGYLPRSQS